MPAPGTEVLEKFSSISSEFLWSRSSLNSKHLYSFGPYRLDPAERVLLRDGVPITLPPKDLETLLVLVENAGHIVEKEELLQKVWPGVFVEEGNLATRVFNLRQALGDAPDGRPYIETIPRRGYRFVASVHPLDKAAGSPVPPLSAAQTPDRAHIPAQNRRLWLWSLGLVVGLAAVGILARHFWPQRNLPSQKVMLAVLPFANLSGDAHEDYFADGLTEEMITQLGQFQPSKLGVIARTSTVRYKDTKETVAQIGRELGVDYLLEGSVRRGGDRVRITAQLIRAAEQTHLWAETYERPLTDVLNIQREIAEKITHSLSIQLLPTETASASSRVDWESYDKYLLGLHELGQGTRDSVNKAIQYFQEGIAKDPKDARLYAALAEAYNASTTYYSSPAEVMPRAKEAALRAVASDPNLAAGHVRLAYVRLFFDWDWPAAEAEYRRALDINPSSPEAQLGYANYLGTLGRFEEALSRVQQAYLFDPLALESRNEALWIYYFSGRMPETIAQCQKTIELEPASDLPYAMLAMAYAQTGQRTETLGAAENAVARAQGPSVLTMSASALARVGQTAQAKQLLVKALEQAKQRYVCRFLVAAAYTELGEKAKAMDSLEQGFLQRST
jgi:TolB-like protein/DNA-binding winged helix-turn-helix (wHTH) protein/Flp pilus assembly protein TadD